jgi:hypothetical protein
LHDGYTSKNGTKGMVKSGSPLRGLGGDIISKAQKE